MTTTPKTKSPPISREKFHEHITHLLVVFIEAHEHITVDEELVAALHRKTQEFLNQILGDEQ